MVGLLKYGAGLPFNRIEKLQSSMGIPLPQRRNGIWCRRRQRR